MRKEGVIRRYETRFDHKKPGLARRYGVEIAGVVKCCRGAPEVKENQRNRAGSEPWRAKLKKNRETCILLPGKRGGRTAAFFP